MNRLWHPLSSTVRRVATAALLCVVVLAPARSAASRGYSGTSALPRVFQPIAGKLAHSPIPVFVPRLVPAIPKSVYAGKIYPLVCPFKAEGRFGAGYQLGLYTDPRYCAGAARLFEINGIAGDVLTVDTHTRPVWLGKQGWAYLTDGGNVGTVISFVRAVKQTMSPQEYTYTIIFGCQDPAGERWARYVACLKRVAASTRLYRL